jgi:hypothetical protein
LETSQQALEACLERALYSSSKLRVAFGLPNAQG